MGKKVAFQWRWKNYLLTIFRIEEQGVPVTLTQLAEYLKMLPVDEGVGTSLPSVGAMIRRMVREDLVETGANKQVVLTRKGRTSAHDWGRLIMQAVA